MTMNTNAVFVEKKLERIAEYTKRLDRVCAYATEEITDDFLKLHALERLLQLIVDEMIDVNNHLIRHSDLKTPDDFQSGFILLAELSILPKDFAQRLAPIVGLRNRLVHRYEEIEPTTLIDTAKKESGDFRDYITYIRKVV